MVCGVRTRIGTAISYTISVTGIISSGYENKTQQPMKNTTKSYLRILMLITYLIGAMAFTGCGGDDLEDVGDEIEDAGEEVIDTVKDAVN